MTISLLEYNFLLCYRAWAVVILQHPLGSATILYSVSLTSDYAFPISTWVLAAAYPAIPTFVRFFLNFLFIDVRLVLPLFWRKRTQSVVTHNLLYIQWPCIRSNKPVMVTITKKVNTVLFTIFR